MKFDILSFFLQNLSKKFKFRKTLTRIVDTVLDGVSTFQIVSR